MKQKKPAHNCPFGQKCNKWNTADCNSCDILNDEVTKTHDAMIQSRRDYDFSKFKIIKKLAADPNFQYEGKPVVEPVNE